MERSLVMFFHAIVIAIVLYVVMVYLLKQKPVVAENRSILLGAIVLIYMVLFGHKLPTSINKNIM
jgi:TRAP-type C4-dicarboxylate transport system permease small subunit